MEYFEASRTTGVAKCSDKACPCPEVTITPGTGYLYVSPELVEFRRDSRTMDEAKAKISRLASEDPLAEMARQSGARSFIKVFVINPILMCEQGARLRGLDLDIAGADAKHWWETGLVPLRPTPIIRQPAPSVPPKKW